MDEPNSPDPLTPADQALRFTQRSAAEWVTFMVASIILLALVGLICFDWQTNQLDSRKFSVALPALQ